MMLLQARVRGSKTAPSARAFVDTPLPTGSDCPSSPLRSPALPPHTKSPAEVQAIEACARADSGLVGIRATSASEDAIGVTSTLGSGSPRLTAPTTATTPATCPPTCVDVDFVADGQLDGADVAYLLGHWGPADKAGLADLDGDGVVGPADLALLLGLWNECR